MKRPDFAESECPCARREREEDGKEPEPSERDESFANLRPKQPPQIAGNI